jgi:hypothetical protein
MSSQNPGGIFARLRRMRPKNLGAFLMKPLRGKIKSASPVTIQYPINHQTTERPRALPKSGYILSTPPKQNKNKRETKEKQKKNKRKNKKQEETETMKQEKPFTSYASLREGLARTRRPPQTPHPPRRIRHRRSRWLGLAMTQRKAPRC